MKQGAIGRRVLRELLCHGTLWCRIGMYASLCGPSILMVVMTVIAIKVMATTTTITKVVQEERMCVVLCVMCCVTFYNRFAHIPQDLLDALSIRKLLVLEANHHRWCRPCVDIRVSSSPRLGLSIVLILFIKCEEGVPSRFWEGHLFESNFCVVILCSWLFDTHIQPGSLCSIAFPFGVELVATLHVSFILLFPPWEEVEGWAFKGWFWSPNQ